MKTKKKPPYNLYSRLRAALRDEWRRSPNVQAIVKASRVAPNTFVCPSCGVRQPMVVREEGKARTQYRVDHIAPVVPLSGFQSWDEYISRLFCGSAGLQVICIPCHKVKTLEETAVRKGLRK